MQRVLEVGVGVVADLDLEVVVDVDKTPEGEQV